MTFTTPEYSKPSRPRWVLPAVVGVVVVALVAAVIVLVLNRGGDHSAPPVSTSPSESATPDQAMPPHKLEWKLINGVRLPYSTVDGPTSEDSGVPRGFSHTPQGAVVAAWHISTRLLSSPDYEQIMAAQVRGSQADRTQIRGVVTQIRNLSAEKFSAYFTPPVGYRVVMYNPAFAQVYFAIPSPNGGYDFQARAVLWNGSDWDYQAVSGLSHLPNSTSLDGFTLF